MRRQIRIVFFVTGCCLSFVMPTFSAQLSGEKFAISAKSGFLLSKPTVAVDFNLYELKFGGRTIAKIYEGNNPDFPYDKAIGRPHRIALGTTLLSTAPIQHRNLVTRDHLVEFSDCDSLCAVHVWYNGLTADLASRVDALVEKIRRKQH